MDIQTLTTFFKWCTILNFILMTFAFLIAALGREWAYQIHSKFFPMPRETFTIVLYAFVSLYEFVFFFFVVIPYVTLLIMG